MQLGTGLRYAGVMLVLLFHSPIVLSQPYGLIGGNNHCYARATLQCLAQIPELKTFAKSFKDLPDDANIPMLYKDLSVKAYAKSYVELIDNMAKGEYNPNLFIRSFHKNFDNDDQQDASEFLSFLLSSFDYWNVPLQQYAKASSDDEKKKILTDEQPASFNKSKKGYEDIFFSSLKSTIKGAGECTHSSLKIDPCMLLQLNLPGKTTTLAECLEAMQMPDEIDDWKCSTCGKALKATKQFSLDDTVNPLILTVQLKRFKTSLTSSKIEKITHAITFPLSIDKATFAKPTNATRAEHLYNLFGIIVQSGNMNNGHYWAHVKDDKSWWKCDESSVTGPTDFPTHDKITNIAETGLEGDATPYILFYRRTNLSPIEQLSQSFKNVIGSLDGFKTSLGNCLKKP